jgi:hypothetical protein
MDRRNAYEESGVTPGGHSIQRLMDSSQGDLFGLQRFLDAQSALLQSSSHGTPRGNKDSHWMWFVFPSQGLGHNDTALR